MAQTIEFPIQKVIDPEASEIAGIGSYQMTREHGGVNQHGEVTAVTVQALDVESKPLANCTIEWFEDSKVMTCETPKRERFQAIWYPDRAEFADLNTRDHFSVQMEGYSS